MTLLSLLICRTSGLTQIVPDVEQTQHANRSPPVIIYVTTERHRYTILDLVKATAGRVRSATYDEVAKQPYLPRAAYIFTDMDRLSPWHLVRAAKTYRMLGQNGLPTYNDPARFLGRYGLLRKLHREGINQFNVYRADSIEKPARWPVFLRVEGDHKEPLSGLIHDQAELNRCIEKLVADGAPLSLLLIIEYAAEEVRPGLYRKLSVFRIGERMVTHTCVHDDQWVAKYGKPAIAPHELYEEEYSMVEGNVYADDMRRVFDLVGLEYGRVDFGLVGGRPQIYEVNSNPDVKLDPKSTGVELRDKSNALFKQRYLAAISVLDFEAAPAA
jgi:hypothetical protein